MQALSSKPDFCRLAKKASPPRTGGQAASVDVFTPSEDLKNARSEPLESHLSTLQRVALVGFGALAAMSATGLATASLETPTLAPESALEEISERSMGGHTDIDLLRTEEPTPELSYGQRLDQEQKQAVGQMVLDLRADGFEVEADDVVNFMAAETGGTFDPAVRAGGNKHGAVGLAQFTQTAIDQLNRDRGEEDQLTKDLLAEMTFSEQSVVVTEYLSSTLGARGMRGEFVSAADLYAAVFAPVAVGKPMTATIYSGGRSYRANRSLDTNNDGRIVKSELTSRLDQWAELGEQLRG